MVANDHLVVSHIFLFQTLEMGLTIPTDAESASLNPLRSSPTSFCRWISTYLTPWGESFSIKIWVDLPEKELPASCIG